MDVGYVRIDEKRKPISEQIEALKSAGCEKIFVEASSKSLYSNYLIKAPQLVCEQLRLCLDSLAAGDRLVVWELRQLGLSIRAVVHLINRLSRDGMSLLSINDYAESTNLPSAALTCAFEKLDGALASERSARSIAIAKTKGRLNGRSLKAGLEYIEVARVLISQGVSVRDAAKQTSISQSTLYRRVGAKS